MVCVNVSLSLSLHKNITCFQDFLIIFFLLQFHFSVVPGRTDAAKLAPTQSRYEKGLLGVFVVRGTRLERTEVTLCSFNTELIHKLFAFLKVPHGFHKQIAVGVILSLFSTGAVV